MGVQDNIHVSSMSVLAVTSSSPQANSIPCFIPKGTGDAVLSVVNHVVFGGELGGGDTLFHYGGTQAALH